MRRGVGLLLVSILVVGLVVGPAAVNASAEHNGGGSGGPGGSAASTPENATKVEDDTLNKSNETIVAQVDSDVDVLDYDYDREAETMSVTLRNLGSDTAAVTITEIISAENQKGEKTSRTFGIEILDLRPRTQVTVEIAVRDEGDMAGVMIVTQQSAQQGSGEALMVDLNEYNLKLIKGEATGGDVRSGAFFGGFGALGLAGLAAWQRKATRNQDVKDATLTPSLNFWGVFRDDD